ncbi:MAG TPA: DUF554 domain-containing protein [Limnochordia bacterium]|nr:DUF554 domain-containing protein [Limnochordia bacterium]
MVLWGSLVNFLAIIAGALVGRAIRLPERIRQTIMQALALAVLIIGISMGLASNNMLIPIAALAIGSILGEVLDIEAGITRAGDKLRRFGGKSDQVGSLDFTQGFLVATLTYCIGAMAVIGSLNSGLMGDHQVLYAKSLIDGVTAIFFSASLGIGVAFSAIPVLLYQGAIALLATVIAPLLRDPVIAELTATGGILIIGIALNMLGLTKLRLGNMLPAILVAVVLALLF